MRAGAIKKFNEAALGVLPITIIVLILNLVIDPMSLTEFVAFLIGAALLVIGLTLYNLGSGSSIEFMGGLIGAEVTKSKRLAFILAMCGTIGVIVTIAEPDLAVLAEQVDGIANFTLIGVVALGVGIFMLIAVLRLVLKIDLKWVLIFFYAVVFVMAFILPEEFVPLAFDSSGVTTGPVTVPFIMALGASLSVAYGGKNSQDSSFGIVGICSIGPVIAVMILCLVANINVATTSASSGYATVEEMFAGYNHFFPHYLKEMAIALLPILTFFLIYNFVAFKLNVKRLLRTLVGVLYVYIGLSVFLLGANVGFIPAGRHIGEQLADKSGTLLILMGAAIGAVIVLAEPAVHVLTKQVEDVTGGVIKKWVMLVVMCISMAISVGLAMTRIVYDIDLRWIITVGYGLALVLTFVVPRIFTGIAFDSGGVASGAMTAAFLLPMANGATFFVYGADEAMLGHYVMTNAFGAVALVAMTPLVAIQVLGLVFKISTARSERARTNEFASLLELEGNVIDLSKYSSIETVINATKRRAKARKSGKNNKKGGRADVGTKGNVHNN